MNYLANPNLAQTDEFVGHYRQIYANNNQLLPVNGAVTGTSTDWRDQSSTKTYTHNYSVSASVLKNGLTFYESAGHFDQSSNFHEPQNKGANFVAGKHNLWPIPSKKIIASGGNISQNPGYY